jgi:hypothetical protein
MIDSQPPPAVAKRIWIDAILLLLLLSLNAVVLVVKGTERFEFFDMSAFMDAGYRVSIGQEPYVDFYYITGPVHLYMHALSFKLFGFTTTAVIVHLCTVSLAVTALVYVIARKYLNRAPSVFLGLLSLYSFYGPVSHPWYDQNATFWLLLGILSWELRFSRFPQLVSVLCGVLSAVSFLTKSNVGGVGGFVLLSLIATQPGRVRHTLMYVAGGVAGIGLMMLILKSPESYVHQAFFAYSTTNRLTNFPKLWTLCYETYNVFVVPLTLLLALLGGMTFIRANASHLALVVSMTVAALFAEWTSSMHPDGNLVWMALQVTYLFVLASRLDFSRLGVRAMLAKTCTWLLIAAASAYCLLVSIERTNLLIVWVWNPRIRISDYELRTPSFKGWRCNGRTGEGLDDVVQFVNDTVPKDESLLVFPDCTMIYGMTNRDSYRKVPFIFHLFQIMKGKLLDDCRDHLRTQPPQWIVLRFDRRATVHGDFQPKGLLEWMQVFEFIRDNYGIVQEFGEFHVLRQGAGKLPERFWKNDLPRAQP